MENPNPKNYELPSHRSNLSDSSSSNEEMEPTQPTCLSLRNIIIALIIIIVVLGAVALLAFNHHPQVEFTKHQFSYHVFCPLSSDKNLVKREHTFMEKLPFTFKPLLEHIKLEKTYVVTAQTVMTSLPEANMPVDQQIHFCGLARPWNGSCQNYDEVEYVCSNPGPIFDLKTNEEIYVFWINNIGNINISLSYGEYYNRSNYCYRVDSYPDHHSENYP